MRALGNPDTVRGATYLFIPQLRGQNQAGRSRHPRCPFFVYRQFQKETGSKAKKMKKYLANK